MDIICWGILVLEEPREFLNSYLKKWAVGIIPTFGDVTFGGFSEKNSIKQVYKLFDLDAANLCSRANL
jgi:hypothetical protein